MMEEWRSGLRETRRRRSRLNFDARMADYRQCAGRFEQALSSSDDGSVSRVLSAYFENYEEPKTANKIRHRPDSARRVGINWSRYDFAFWPTGGNLDAVVRPKGRRQKVAVVPVPVREPDSGGTLRALGVYQVTAKGRDATERCSVQHLPGVTVAGEATATETELREREKAVETVQTEREKPEETVQRERKKPEEIVRREREKAEETAQNEREKAEETVQREREKEEETVKREREKGEERVREKAEETVQWEREKGEETVRRERDRLARSMDSWLYAQLEARLRELPSVPRLNSPDASPEPSGLEEDTVAPARPSVREDEESDTEVGSASFVSTERAETTTGESSAPVSWTRESGRSSPEVPVRKLDAPEVRDAFTQHEDFDGTRRTDTRTGDSSAGEVLPRNMLLGSLADNSAAFGSSTSSCATWAYSEGELLIPGSGSYGSVFKSRSEDKSLGEI